MTFFVQTALMHTSRALVLCHGIVLLWSIAVTIHCNGSMLCVYGDDGLLPLVRLPSDARVGADALQRPHVLLSITVLLLGCASAMVYLMFCMVLASLAPAHDAFRRQLGRASACVLIVVLLLEFLHSLIVAGHVGFTSAAGAETRAYLLQHDAPFLVTFVATVVLLLASPVLRHPPVEPPQTSLIWRPLKLVLGVVAVAMLLLAVATYCMPLQSIDVIRHIVGDRSPSMHEIVHSGNAHPFAFISLSAPLELAMTGSIVPMMLLYAVRSNSDLMAACCLVPNSLLWSGALLALALQDASVMRSDTRPVGIDPVELNRWIIAMFVATVLAFVLQGYFVRCAWLQHRSRLQRDNVDIGSMRGGDEIDSERTESSLRSVSDSDSASAAPLPAHQRMSKSVALGRVYSEDDLEEDRDDDVGAVFPARQQLRQGKA